MRWDPGIYHLYKISWCFGSSWSERWHLGTEVENTCAPCRPPCAGDSRCAISASHRLSILPASPGRLVWVWEHLLVFRQTASTLRTSLGCLMQKSQQHWGPVEAIPWVPLQSPHQSLQPDHHRLSPAQASEGKREHRRMVPTFLLWFN